MAVTIYDIAKKCNTSTTTVSKAFNNSKKISLKKKQEILEVAKKLGYAPSQSARSLASNSKASKLIGVVLHTNENKSITHEMFSNILNSFRIEMEQYDYDICFLRNIQDADEISYGELISARGLDGVFIIAADSTEKKVKELLKEDIPLVAFDNVNAKYQITSDNKEAVAKMVDYLVSMGHRRICYVYPHNYGVSQERYEGFLLGLERNNIPFDQRMIIDAPFYCTNSAQIATDKALQSGINPTVIMYPDDYTAIHAIPYLRKLGLKVPSNISITGFDGLNIADAIRPSLTTIRQNAKEIGLKAAEMLLKQINKQEIQTPHVVLEAELIKAKSVLDI